jgi:hypothetical protein
MGLVFRTNQGASSFPSTYACTTKICVQLRRSWLLHPVTSKALSTATIATTGELEWLPQHSKLAFAGSSAVNFWIQLRVVVHLELPVEFETSSSCLNILPQQSQTISEISSLLQKNLQALAVSLNVFGSNILPLRLLSCVKDLK